MFRPERSMRPLCTTWVIYCWFWCLCVWPSLSVRLSTTQSSLTSTPNVSGKSKILSHAVTSNTYGFTANVRFTFKCMIIKSPGLTTFVTITISTFILAYFLRVFEIEYYRQLKMVDFDSYFQAVWVIVASITTVGFGDLVPYSYMGRIIIMISAFWGAFLISLMIVTIG